MLVPVPVSWRGLPMLYPSISTVLVHVNICTHFEFSVYRVIAKGIFFFFKKWTSGFLGIIYGQSTFSLSMQCILQDLCLFISGSIVPFHSTTCLFSVRNMLTECFVITAMVISLEIRISYLQHYIYCAGLLCLEICAPILILEFCYDWRICLECGWGLH